MPDIRIVGCEACGTEGRIIVEGHDYARRDGNVYRDVIVDDPCDCCEGTGGEIIPVEPIEQEDLEMAYG